MIRMLPSSTKISNARTIFFSNVVLSDATIKKLKVQGVSNVFRSLCATGNESLFCRFLSLPFKNLAKDYIKIITFPGCVGIFFVMHVSDMQYQYFIFYHLSNKRNYGNKRSKKAGNGGNPYLRFG